MSTSSLYRQLNSCELDFYPVSVHEYFCEVIGIKCSNATVAATAALEYKQSKGQDLAQLGFMILMRLPRLGT